MVDTTRKPELDQIIAANCGEEIVFRPIRSDWMNPWLCSTCLVSHSSFTVNALTFAVSK